MTLNLARLLRDGAARHPEATALLCGERSFSYHDLDRDARRLAAVLAKAGLRRGRHLAVMLPNVPEFTLVYFAAHTLGAPLVPLSVQLMPDEIAFHLTDSDAVMLVAAPDCLERARAGIERAGGAARLLAAGSEETPGRGGAPRSKEAGRSPGPVPWIEDLLDAETAPLDLAATRPDDTAVILYTSGTTGRPKGAELTHFNLFSNADVMAGPMLRLDSATVALCALPLFHSFGQTVTHNAVLRSGGSVVLLPRFDAAEAVRLIGRHQVNFFAGVPTMYIALRRAAAAAGVRLSSLARCVSGGAPMPVEVLRGFDAEHGVDIRESYGLSETSPVASLNVLDRPKRPGSIGVPIDGVEFRLVDDAGHPIDEPLRRGEICIRGHNVMKGYHKRPEATAATIQDGWLFTGDIAHRDTDGYYHIVDRRKDLILRAGYNVYPREVEEVLYGHPCVAEAAVVGVPDLEKGEEVKAVIVAKAGRTATAEEIISWCRERMAAFKCPRLIEFRDALPKGPTGKILKRALRE
jgi:long-chain acyl-CoA synthetase